MPSELKLLMAEELARDYTEGTDYVVVGYTKLSGPEMVELRRTLRDSRVRLKMVKNAVAVRVLESAGVGAGSRFLQGPSGLVTGQVEMPELCRVMRACAEKYREKLFVRGGVMGGRALAAEDVSRLASIPPLPVLHARIAGAIQTTVAGVARAFHGLLRGLACALEGIRKQKEGEASPPGPPADASGASPGEQA